MYLTMIVTVVVGSSKCSRIAMIWPTWLDVLVDYSSFRVPRHLIDSILDRNSENQEVSKQFLRECTTSSYSLEAFPG